MDATARRLAEICGPGFSRPAGAADEVGGAPARLVAVPGTAEAAAQVLRLAAEDDRTVAFRGAGTKMDWGWPSSGVDILVDAGRLAGLHQSPEGDVIEVGAGTPLRAVEARLERTGQRLPITVPSRDATIGGLLAADEVGPLPVRQGTAGEQVIGVSYLDAEGSLFRAGSPVTGGAGAGTAAYGTVDAAAGLEPVRLFAGSLGTLGLLVSVALPVQPIPASRRWVCCPVETPRDVPALVSEVLGTFAPAAVEMDFPGADPKRPPGPVTGTVAVLLEGGPVDVTERANALAKLVGRDAQVTAVPPVWWGCYPSRPEDVTLLRIDVPVPRSSSPSPPAQGLSAAHYALFDRVGRAVPVRGSAGRGVLHAVLAGSIPADEVARIVDSVRMTLFSHDGRCRIVVAPPAVRGSVDFSGDLPDLVARHGAKERTDPRHRLAPGRLRTR